MNKFLCVLPAREGSKRLPNKNILPFAGTPLISHIINITKQVFNNDQIFISTDSQKISNLANKSDVRVDFLRPKNLARDNSSIIQTLKYIVSKLSDINKFKYIVLIQPTSPLIESSDIKEAIYTFKAKKTDTLISVVKNKHHPYYCWKINYGQLQPFFSLGKQLTSRNLLKDMYVENGAITIFKKELLQQNTIYGNKITPYIMPFEKSVDIDEKIDLDIAEYLYKKRSL